MKQHTCLLLTYKIYTTNYLYIKKKQFRAIVFIEYTCNHSGLEIFILNYSIKFYSIFYFIYQYVSLRFHKHYLIALLHALARNNYSISPKRNMNNLLFFFFSLSQHLEHHAKIFSLRVSSLPLYFLFNI